MASLFVSNHERTHTHSLHTAYTRAEYGEREREKSTDVRMPDWLIHIGIHTKRTLANVAIVETAIGNNSKTHTLCIHSFCVRCCLFLAHFPSPSFAWIDDTKQLRPQNTRIFFYCVSNFDFEFVTLFSLFFQFKYLNLHLVPLEKSQSLNGDSRIGCKMLTIFMWFMMRVFVWQAGTWTCKNAIWQVTIRIIIGYNSVYPFSSQVNECICWWVERLNESDSLSRLKRTSTKHTTNNDQTKTQHMPNNASSFSYSSQFASYLLPLIPGNCENCYILRFFFPLCQRKIQNDFCRNAPNQRD